MKVSDLVDAETGNWSVDLIAAQLGYAAAIHIIANIPPPRDDRGEDSLIFLLNSNGCYSVKKGYLALTGQVTQSGIRRAQVEDSKLWARIWHEGEAPPRSRLFLWKLAQEALPLGNIMFTRLKRGDPTCMMCGQEAETATHLALTCPFSRSCWFASDLALTTGNSGNQIKVTLLLLARLLTAEQWSSLVATMWGIWRCRNDCVFQGMTPALPSVLKYRRDIILENRIAASVGTKLPRVQDSLISLTAPPENGMVCFVDGSWAFGWIGGAGHVFLLNGTLTEYRFERTVVSGALHAEACALLTALNTALKQGYSEVCFLTDCKTLAEACTGTQPPLEIDWRASKEIFDIWKKLKCNSGLSCYHIGRGHNEMADTLAKKGRKLGESYTGYTYPIFPIELSLDNVTG